MVVLITQIESNCFYIVLSILLVWCRSDLFNVSLKITGYVSLHDQILLHKTLSKLVFTSHCICFYYIMVCPVSSTYTIGVVSFAWSQYIGCWLWTGHCSSYLFPAYLFPALFANQVLICFMSAAHVSPVLSSLHLRCVGSTCTLGLSWGIILVQWLLLWTSHRFNTFIFHLVTVYLHHFRSRLPYFVCFWFE